jgi:transcriptional regulator with XRE-family HTH domain
MQAYERTSLRRELEEAMLPLRLARKRKGQPKGGWLRGIRLAVGLPVEEAARRMGVKRWEIHRLEASERDSRIMLSTLERAAAGLGFDLVYGLVPREGTLEDLASAQTQAHEEALEKKRAAREAEKAPWVEFIGWRETFLKALQTMLRREGYRVRPRKTDRGDEQKMIDFEQGLRALKLAGMLGPFMKEFMEGRERGNEGPREQKNSF